MDHRLLLPILGAVLTVKLGGLLAHQLYGWLTFAVLFGGLVVLLKPLSDAFRFLNWNWATATWKRLGRARHRDFGQAGFTSLVALVLLVAGASGINLWWQAENLAADPLLQAWLGGQSTFQVQGEVMKSPMQLQTKMTAAGPGSGMQNASGKSSNLESARGDSRTKTGSAGSRDQTVADKKQQLVVQLVAAKFKTVQSFSTQVPVRVFVDDWPDYPVGTRVEFQLRLSERLGAGASATSNELATDRFSPIALLDLQTGRAVGEPRKIAGPSGFAAWTNLINTRLREGLKGFPAAQSLLPAMIMGQQNALTPAERKALQTSGLIHLVCVSGMHMAIVLAGVRAATNRIAKATVRVTAGVSFLALVGYLQLLGASASLIRAGFMAVSSLFALVLGRPQLGLQTLYLTVIMLLIFAPAQVLEVGFLLSAGATAAIICLHEPWQNIWQLRFRRWEKRYRNAWPFLLVGRPLVAILGVSLVAQLATCPLLLLIRPGISSYALISNLLVHPVVVPLMWLGIGFIFMQLLAVFLGAYVPVVGEVMAFGVQRLAVPVAKILDLLSAWLFGVADRISNWPGALIPWPQGAWGIGALCLVAGGSYLWLCSYRHHRKV